MVEWSNGRMVVLAEDVRRILESSVELKCGWVVHWTTGTVCRDSRADWETMSSVDFDVWSRRCDGGVVEKDRSLVPAVL